MIGNPIGFDIGGVTLVELSPVVPYRSVVTLDDIGSPVPFPVSGTLVDWSGFVVTPAQADADETTFLNQWEQ